MASMASMASTGSTCSVSSITDSATTSSFRGVLNTRAVLQDLEGSEEYDSWLHLDPSKHVAKSEWYNHLKMF